MKIKNIKNFDILWPVLYECKTWSIILSEEKRLMVFENTVLRMIFGHRRVQMIGDERKLLNEELRDLFLTSRS